MVGQGVLRECLLDPEVDAVTTIGRSATGAKDAKLRGIVHKDLQRYESIESQLTGFDACFFCLGVTSGGKSESEYTPLTYGITLAAAECLVRLNPGMTFLYVSGAGADSTEKGRTMWARVRGRTENALFRLPFRAVYVFRPAAIIASHGERSRTAAYRISYALLGPFTGIGRIFFPSYFLTTEELSRAMLKAVRTGAPKNLMESPDIAAFVR